MAGIRFRDSSFFFFFLESLEMNGQGMDTKGAIIGRDCFSVGFGNARVKNGFLKGDENVISFFFLSCKGYFRESTKESHPPIPVTRFPSI